jgi:hypothetical protein
VRLYNIIIMNKQTKFYVGAAVLLVAGYMVYKNMQDKNKVAPKQFVGMKKKKIFKSAPYGGTYGQVEPQGPYGKA